MYSNYSTCMCYNHDVSTTGRVRNECESARLACVCRVARRRHKQMRVQFVCVCSSAHAVLFRKFNPQQSAQGHVRANT